MLTGLKTKLSEDITELKINIKKLNKKQYQGPVGKFDS